MILGHYYGPTPRSSELGITEDAWRYKETTDDKKPFNLSLHGTKAASVTNLEPRASIIPDWLRQFIR